MKTYYSLFIIIATYISTFCSVQIDTKGFLFFSEEKPGAGSLSKTNGYTESSLLLQRRLGEDFSIYIQNNITGTTKHAAFQETDIPFDNFTSMGLNYINKASFHAGISNNIYGGQEPLMLNYLPSDSTVFNKTLNSANGMLEVKGDRLNLLLDITYFNLLYDLRYDKNKITKSVDNDMWTIFDFSINLINDISLGFGTTLKNDFNNYNGFDYGDHYLILKGDNTLKIGKRKIYLLWNISGHWRISEAVYLNADAQGPAFTMQLRPVIRLKKRKFITASIKYDLSEKMKKQQYELGFRKAWRNRTSLNIGYWNYLGGFINRQAGIIDATIYVSKKSVFALSPSLQVYWRKSINTEYRYYRTTASFKMVLSPFNRAEMYLGYEYTHFLHLSPFTERGSLYLGVRSW